MTETISREESLTRSAVAEIAQDWIASFTDFVTARDASRIPELFVPHGSWRDLLALSWQMRSAIGTDRIADLLADHIQRTLSDVTLRQEPAPELVTMGGGMEWIQAFFTFKVDGDSAQGMVRLLPTDDGWKAWTVVTDLLELRDRGRPVTWDNIATDAFTKAVPGYKNWADRRAPGRDLDNSSPTVLVVGAGHAGLHIAARLAHLGVDAVIIERASRLGDNWRQRHYNLRTHTPSFSDSFPYLDFPKNWPISVEKDKLADWIEYYASAMDLNVHTSTEFTSGNYDESTGRWTVEVTRADGSKATLHPKHLVLATGLLSRKYIPELEGADDFEGVIMHSSEYRGGPEHIGKRVVVVGTGASGHDIAQDLHEQGVADVTLVQRSPTYVMSFEHGIPASYGAMYDPALDPEIAHLLYKSFPLPVAAEVSKSSTGVIAEKDRELLDGLRAAGFQLLEDTAMLELAYSSSTVSGYYINQGCSDLIIDGSISLKNGAVVGFSKNEVLFADGSSLPADAVVLCTGFQNMRESVRAILGSEVADKLPVVWIPDSTRGGEHGGLWTESGYPHLWLQAGGLQHSSVYSRYLALKIAALEAGLVDEGTPAAT